MASYWSIRSFAQPGALSWPKVIRSLSVCPRTPLPAAALAIAAATQRPDLELRVRSGGPETTPSYQPSPLPRPEFRLLEHLTLQATVTAECARVLAMFSFPVLKELGMVMRIYDVGLLKPLSQTIHDHCSHESLHTSEASTERTVRAIQGNHTLQHTISNRCTHSAA